MAKSNFILSRETFGFDTNNPWALDAIKLIYSLPRTYMPLVESYDKRYPKTKYSLNKLCKLGYVQFQDPVIVDLLNKKLDKNKSRPTFRYIITTKGRNSLNKFTNDEDLLFEKYSRLTRENSYKVLKLLSQFNIDKVYGSVGKSLNIANLEVGLPERTARWWVNKFLEDGYIKRLDLKESDSREVIPGHYRPTRLLTNQLILLYESFPENFPEDFLSKYKIRKTKFLNDISPTSIGLNGSTDFDHDINTQKILALLIQSESYILSSSLSSEPRISLNISKSGKCFDVNSDIEIFYQPDAIFYDFASMKSRINILEYERFQSRKDGWSHIDKFIGFLNQYHSENTQGSLRFVVDSTSRLRAYVELIEAYASFAEDFIDKFPAIDIKIYAQTYKSLSNSNDPLNDSNWFYVRIKGNASRNVSPIFSGKDFTIYKEYFSRGGLE